MSENNKNFQKQVDEKLGKSNPQHPVKNGARIKQQQRQHPTQDQNDGPDEKDRMVPDKIGPGVPAGDIK